MGSFEMNVMYSTLFNAVFADSFFSPMRTVYVVSDTQLEEIKRKQREEELDIIMTSRKSLEESYQARVKVLDEREHEIKEEIKAFAPAKEKKKKKKKKSSLGFFPRLKKKKKKKK